LLDTDGLVESERDLLAGAKRFPAACADGRGFDDARPARALVEALVPAQGAPDDIAAMLVFIR
jgi:hypothetical protein